MQYGADLARGQTVRLITPYLDAQRGMYTVDYVYSNGSLSVLSHADGRRYEVPAHICRQVVVKSQDTD